MSEAIYNIFRNYSYERYTYLLKKFFNSKLNDKEFAKRYEFEYKELISHREQITDQVYFNSSDEYKRLLKAYLSDEMTINEFRFLFNKIYLGEWLLVKTYVYDLEKLANFSIDWRAKGFSDLLARIHAQLGRIVSPDMPFFVDDKTFKMIIQQILDEMEYKFANENDFSKSTISTEMFQDEKVFGIKIDLVIVFVKNFNLDSDTKVLLGLMSFLIIITGFCYSFLKPEIYNVFFNLIH